MTIGTMAEIDGFSPSQNRWDTNGLLYANTVYDPLMAVAEDGSVQPYLAESLTPNAAYDVWTLTLRPDVTFHDGTALTSTVVKHNFDALATSSLTSGAVAGIASVTTPDELTVVFRLKSPGHRLRRRAHHPGRVRRGAGDTGPGDVRLGHAGGHGAVRVRLVAAEQPLHRRPANPHYWQKGLPYLDQVTFRPIVDTTQREDSLKTGAVDALVSIDAKTYAHFDGTPGYQALFETSPVIGSPTMGFMLLNCARPPTDDLRIRTALAKATDQVAIQKVFGDGIGPGHRRHLPARVALRRPHRPTRRTTRPGRRRWCGSTRRSTARPRSRSAPRPTRARSSSCRSSSRCGAGAGVDVSITIVQQADAIIDLLTGEYQAVPSAQFGAVNPDLNYPWLSTTTVQPIGTVGLNFARNSDPAIEQAFLDRPLDPRPCHPGPGVPDGQRAAGDGPALRLDRQGHLPVRRVDRVQGIRPPDPPRRPGRLRLQRGRVLPGAPLARRLTAFLVPAGQSRTANGRQRINDAAAIARPATVVDVRRSSRSRTTRRDTPVELTANVQVGGAPELAIVTSAAARSLGGLERVAKSSAAISRSTATSARACRAYGSHCRSRSIDANGRETMPCRPRACPRSWATTASRHGPSSSATVPEVTTMRGRTPGRQ